jgi:hypothetical protein
VRGPGKLGAQIAVFAKAVYRSKAIAGSGALAYPALAGLIDDWDATPNAGTKL